MEIEGVGKKLLMIREVEAVGQVSGHYKNEVCCARFSHAPMNTLQHGKRDPLLHC